MSVDLMVASNTNMAHMLVAARLVCREGKQFPRC